MDSSAISQTRTMSSHLRIVLSGRAPDCIVIRFGIRQLLFRIGENAAHHALVLALHFGFHAELVFFGPFTRHQNSLLSSGIV